MRGGAARVVSIVFLSAAQGFGQGGVAATIAGSTRVNGALARGFSGDGGLARRALFAFANQQNDCDPNRFEQISHLAVDAAGNVFVADSANHRVRRIDAQWNVTTVAGSGQSPQGCATPDNAIGDGPQATAARLFYPAGIALHPNGNLIIADQQQNRVRQVTPGGAIATVAGNGLHAFYAPGVPALSSGLDWPTAVAVSPGGLVHFTELHSGRVARIGADGRLTTVAGIGIPGFNGESGPANTIRLLNPTGLGFDAAGNLYIADQGNNRIRKVTPDGALTTIAQAVRPADVKADARGNVYFTEIGSHSVRRIDAAGVIATVAGTGVPVRGPDGVSAESSALSSPTGLAVNADGDVFVVDWGNALVRMIVFSERPVIASDGVLNSANFTVGPLAPGSLFSVFGSKLTGAVRVNGQNAPVNFANAGQVNAQVPYGASGEAAVTVGTSPPEPVTIAPASIQPFVYAGTRRAIAVNQDGSLNGPENPESRGRVVVIYATGIGAVTPEIETGQAAPLDRLLSAAAPYSATLGGVNAPVLFLGLAPGFIGLAQANILIPEGAGPELAMRVGDSESAPVTVSIR